MPPIHFLSLADCELNLPGVPAYGCSTELGGIKTPGRSLAEGDLIFISDLAHGVKGPRVFHVRCAEEESAIVSEGYIDLDSARPIER